MKQKGFTLVELVIVIGVIGILAAVAIPTATSSLNEHNVDLAARQLAADLRWMQQLSVNSAGGSASPFIAPDPLPQINFYNAEPYGYYITLNLKVIKAVRFTGNVRINSPIPSVFAFSINGNPPNGKTIYLQCGSAFRNVVIDSVGRIRIVKP